jgi:hypothetical protein
MLAEHDEAPAGQQAAPEGALARCGMLIECRHAGQTSITTLVW